MTTDKDKIQRMLKWAEEIGVRPLPLHSTNHSQKKNGDWYGGKAPIGKGWGLREHTAEEFLYRHPKGNHGKAWLKNGEMRCVGFQLGPASKGLIDIDLDSEEAIDRADEFFGDLNPIQYGRGGIRTHMLLRVSDVPAEIQAKYTGMLKGDDGEETGVELRTGYGLTKSGDPEQLQSMVMGRHPDTGEKLVWIGSPPRRFEDFPMQPFSNILERFSGLCDAIGARKVWVREAPRKAAISRRQFEDDGIVERIRSALPPLSVIAAEYAGDSPSGGGNQQCPVCQNGKEPVLSVDDDAGLAYCFWDGCETRALGSRGGFDVFHLVSHIEGFREFTDCLEFLAKRAGVPFERNRKKAKPTEKKETKDERIRKIMAVSKAVADRYIYLHGDLYTTFDNVSWLPAVDHFLKVNLRDKLDEMYGDHASPNLMADLEATTKAFATPPSESPKICPPENYGCSMDWTNGKLLEGTAFQDRVVYMSDDGKLSYKNREKNELYVNALPHTLPMGESATPIWDEFMQVFADGAVGGNRSEMDDLIATIHTMIGACIFDNRMEKFWILYGKGGSGKGVILRVLRAIVGARNWYATTLDAASSRFIVANMRNKKVVSLPEMEYRPSIRSQDQYNRSVDVFKRITGRDPVGIEVKYMQYSFDAVIDANVVAASNSLTEFPRDGEEGTAWGRRLVVIPTPPPVLNPDFSLAKKIIASELSGIIRASIDFYADALADGRVPVCKKSIELVRDASASKWTSFGTMFETAPENTIFNSELKEIVAEFMEIEYGNVRPGHMFQAKTALRDAFGAKIPESPIWNFRKGKNERGIIGVAQKTLHVVGGEVQEDIDDDF